MTTDIKPDTSLYPNDLPSRFRALVLIAEGLAAGKTVEYKNSAGDWDLASTPLWRNDRHYRLKPEPRVVWVNFYADGIRRAFHYESEREARMAASPCDLIATAVRVELPE